MGKKIALITDSHFGIRKDNPIILKKQEEFFSKIFFPVIDKLEIKNVGHLGDVFHKRKEINFLTLEASKRMFFEPLKNRNIDVFCVIGNHDTYYTNTNDVNSVEYILSEQYNWKSYRNPETINVLGVNVCIIPWITKENKEKCFKELEQTKAKILMGHLEIQGFNITKGHPSLKGLDPEIFKKFDISFSGHFHIKSSNKNIHYLGTPAQYTWDDFGEPKGFHIFDVETKKLTFIPNKIEMFKKLIYNGPDSKIENITDCYVKIYVENNDAIGLEKYIKEVENNKPIEVKVINNKRLNVKTLEEDENGIQLGNTESIITDYIDKIKNDKIDKENVKTFMLDLYKEALEVK